ncbi:MAG: DNA-processing protein DprA [Actinomycetales bacterium]
MNLTRLRLFHAIEPGDKYWIDEINRTGPDSVLENLLDPHFTANRKSIERIRERLKVPVDKLVKEITDVGGSFLTENDSNWPHQLQDLITPPIGLVVRGEMPTCNSVAIVGTRNPTTYGARISSEFAAGFADRGVSVISGGAFGIDTHAHRGALAAEGKTIAVLASGIAIRYPASNERLFEEILENGALISEVMPFERARPERFLTRNRLIAALARCTIVVEAAFRSGSLRTARDAAELLRIVLAVPGPINSPTSDGCHRLIGERCAEIVTSVPDAMEFLVAQPCTLCGDVT